MEGLIDQMKIDIELHDYWCAYRPEDWLSPSKRKTAPICDSAISRIFKNAKKTT
ncbi:hypothetical protein J7K93_00760 [bacterium]|nr:hypothetical protein [bacterium]